MANSDLPGPAPVGPAQPPVGGADGVALSGAHGVGVDVAPPAASSSSRADAVVFLLASTLAGVVLAFPAAWIWSQVADPPAAPLTSRGVSFGEVQLNQQSEVTMWFLVVGFGFGLLSGMVVGWLGERRGTITVLAVLALSSVGSGLAAYLGITVFGPDAGVQAAAAAVGDRITSDLSVGSALVYLGWPIGGLLGACSAIFFWSVPSNDLPPTPPSRSLVAQSPST